jgi:hypothetical protein
MYFNLFEFNFTKEFKNIGIFCFSPKDEGNNYLFGFERLK